MRQASKRIPDIRGATRRHHSAEEKIRIVLEGLRGEVSIAEHCRKEGINQNLYYRWSVAERRQGRYRSAFAFIGLRPPFGSLHQYGISPQRKGSSETSPVSRLRRMTRSSWLEAPLYRGGCLLIRLSWTVIPSMTARLRGRLLWITLPHMPHSLTQSGAISVDQN